MIQDQRKEDLDLVIELETMTIQARTRAELGLPLAPVLEKMQERLDAARAA